MFRFFHNPREKKSKALWDSKCEMNMKTACKKQNRSSMMSENLTYLPKEYVLLGNLNLCER